MPDTAAKPPALRAIIGANIRHARTALGWSQEKLAVRAHLSLNFIGNLERGHVNVSADSLERIAACLGIQANALLLPSPQE